MNTIKKQQDLEKEMKEFEETYDIPLNISYYRELQAELKGITFVKEEILKEIDKLIQYEKDLKGMDCDYNTEECCDVIIMKFEELKEKI